MREGRGEGCLPLDRFPPRCKLRARARACVCRSERRAPSRTNYRKLVHFLSRLDISRRLSVTVYGSSPYPFLIFGTRFLCDRVARCDAAAAPSGARGFLFFFLSRRFDGFFSRFGASFRVPGELGASRARSHTHTRTHGLLKITRQFRTPLVENLVH